MCVFQVACLFHISSGKKRFFVLLRQRNGLQEADAKLKSNYLICPRALKYKLELKLFAVLVYAEGIKKRLNNGVI